jgi:hypothetical protein
VIERELAGDQRGALSVSIFQHFLQVASFGVGEGREAPVVEDVAVLLLSVLRPPLRDNASALRISSLSRPSPVQQRLQGSFVLLGIGKLDTASHG